MANSVDSDVTVRHEPCHLDLDCLLRYLSWSVGVKGLMKKNEFYVCLIQK